ncbi:MAG: MATE family efflux transporter [Clostridia bacterium]|nr:MATE family efflux transporter [Clostridia bacterium]
MSKPSRTEIFETLPVRQAVLRQIAPAILSQLITLIYNLADTYFVGMLNDPAETAAVTVAAPPFLLLTAISNLFGVGGAAVIARSLGKKEIGKAKEASAFAFYGAFAAAIAFSCLFLLFAEPILTLCGANADTYAKSFGYAKWTILFGGFATILNLLLANLVRAEGSAFHASLGVSMGGILNIILDPIFVLPRFLGMGAVGAGMATAISNLAAVCYFLIYIRIRRESTVLSVSPGLLSRGIRHAADVLKTGMPASIQYLLTVVTVAALSKFVSKYGTAAVAALGIVKKLDQLPLFFSIGLSNGLLPFLAYNHASGNGERRKAGFRFGCLVSVSFSVFCLIIYECFAPFLTGLFIDDGETLRYAAAFLRIMVTAMPSMSLVYPMIVQFQGMGRVKESLICSILRKGVLDIPLLFILDAIIPLYGCAMVQPIVDALSLAVAFVFYRRIGQETR